MFVDGSLLAAGACGGVAALAIITATPFLTRWFCATHTPAPPPLLISTTKKEEEAERTPPAEDIQGPHCAAVDELHNTQVVVEDHHPRTSPTVPTTRPVSWSSTTLPNHTTHHHNNHNNNNTSIKSHNLCPSLGSSSSSILVYRPQDDMDRVAFAHLHHTDYVPLRRIGRGAFAVVYLVERRTDGRHFALKYVALSDERRRAMAFREGDLLSRVQGHAGIVAVEDIHLHYNFSPAHAQKQHPAAATTTTATASSSLVAAGGAGVVGQVPRTLRSSSTTITTTITTAGSVRNTQSGSVPPPRRGRATSTSTLPATPTPQPGAMLLLGESTPHMTANVVYDCGGDVERRDDEEEEDEEDDDEDVVLGLTTAAPLVSAGTAPAFDEDEATPHQQQQQQVAPSPPCMIAPPPTTTTTTTPAAASISSPVASPSHTSAGDSIAARGAGFGSATALSNASFTSPTAAAPLYRNFSFRDGVDVRRAASSSALFPPPHPQLQQQHQHQSSLPATSSSFADASMMMPRHGPSPLHFTNFTPADGGVGGSVEALNNSSMTMATAAVAAAAAGISSAAPPMMGATIASASSLTNIPPPSMQFRECWRGGGSASVVEQRYLPHTSNVGVMHTPSPSSWHVGGDSSIIKDVAAPSPPPTTTTTKTAGSPNTLLATLFGNLNEAVVAAASAAAAGTTPTPTTTTTNTRPPPTPTDGECGATSTPSTTTTEVSTVAGESSVAGFMAIVTTFHECGDLASYVMRHDRRIPRRRRKPSSSHATATQTHAMEEVDEVADDEVAESGSALNKNAFTEPQLLSIAFQLANVLVHLHRQRPAVVHRDLKPENILLAPPTAPPRTSMMTMMASRTTRASDTGGESQDAAASVSPPHAHNTPPPPHIPCQRFTTSIIPIVVADFGLAMLSAEDRDLIPVNAIFGGDDGGDGVDGSSAHRLATSRSGKTLPRHTGIGGGTRPFISPESWRGQTCTASDVWSYGCVLYALATGRVTAARVRIMSREARSEGFATMVLNDVLEAGYSLELASFVVSLLITDPLKRPTAEMARRCFRSTTEEVCFDLHSPFFSNMLDL